MAHKRRIILLNRDFQFRFSFYVCSWLITLSLAYPLIIANVFDFLIASLAHDPLAPQVAGLLETRTSLLWLLVLMQFVLTSLTFGISLFMSHKIAGPLFKLKRFFREVQEGDMSQTLSFRKKDYFQDLVPEYNFMMESIRGRFEKTSASVASSISLIEKSLDKATPETRRDLRAALDTLKEALKETVKVTRNETVKK